MSDLQTRINSSITDFVQSLNMIKDDTFQKNKQVEETLLKLGIEIDELRRKDKDRQTAHENAVIQVKNREAELRTATEALDKERNITNQSNSDIQKSVAKQKELEKTADLLAKSREAELEKQKKISATLQLKLDTLKLDTEKIENRDKTLNDRENKLKQREIVCIKKEEQVAEKEHELAGQELDMKLKQQKIEFEMKKLKLNG